jgi:hypothetical protein
MLSVNFLILYGFIYAIVSFVFLRDGTVYQFIRTLPIYYSIFAFFLGIEFVKKTLHLTLKNSYIQKYKYLFVLLNLFGEGRLSNQSALPLLFYDGKLHKALLFLVILLVTAYKRGITSYVIFVAYVVFLLVNQRRMLQKLILNKYVLFVSVCCFLGGLYYVNQEFSDFYKIGFAYFKTNMVHVDVWWRLMFWAYEFGTQVIHNLFFGIGFGTKLFDMTDFDAGFLIYSNPTDLNYEYTLGTHNSFMFILIRLGLVGLFPVLCIYAYFFKQINLYRVLNDPLVATCGISYLFISLSALFNVVIESPLYASTYWILTGMFYQSVQKNKIIVKCNKSPS